MCGVIGLVASFTFIIERDVGVGVNDARSQVFPAGIDHRNIGRRGYVFTYSGDFAILHINAAALDVAVSFRHHDGVFDQDIVVRV
jgi:hypothetical protein